MTKVQIDLATDSVRTYINTRQLIYRFTYSLQAEYDIIDRSGIGINIPNHLLNCYRRNVTEVLDKLKIPMTIPILIDLLQKVEMNKHLDMRLLSTATLYQ